MYYRISFQNPDVGIPQAATFCAGRLSIRTYDQREWETKPESLRDAEQWAKAVSGRYRKLDDATEALRNGGVNVDAEGGWEELG